MYYIFGSACAEIWDMNSFSFPWEDWSVRDGNGKLIFFWRVVEIPKLRALFRSRKSVLISEVSDFRGEGNILDLEKASWLARCLISGILDLEKASWLARCLISGAKLIY